LSAIRDHVVANRHAAYLSFESSWKQHAFVTWIRCFAIGSDLTGVSAPVSFYSGPFLFCYLVLGPYRCPGVFYMDLTDAPVPISLIPVTSSRATNLSFHLINRISSSHYCLWVWWTELILLCSLVGV
jgi:hypothetical protein